MFSLRTILFDAFQVDRLVVLPAWRGVGAKELLLALGGGAFHRLGLPCRIKTVREQCNRLRVPALSIIKKTLAKCKFFRSCRSELVRSDCMRVRPLGGLVLSPVRRRPAPTRRFWRARCSRARATGIKASAARAAAGRKAGCTGLTARQSLTPAPGARLRLPGLSSDPKQSFEKGTG